MIDFMILGYPRSGTTWLANLFTTDKTLCLHDPMAHLTTEKLENYKTDKRFGFACTGSFVLTDWVNSHKCPKVVIVRDKKECDDSLVEIGLSPMTDECYSKLFELDAVPVPFSDLFKPEVMARMWEYLIPGISFDTERFNLLSTFHVEPSFRKVEIQSDAVREYLSKIKRSYLCHS